KIIHLDVPNYIQIRSSTSTEKPTATQTSSPTTTQAKCNTVTEKVSSIPNLDRIDQEQLPLDGKYKYPSSDGFGVNVYIVDTGINLDNVEFEGRAKFGGTLESIGISVNNATESAIGLGIHVVVAAGNFGVDACDFTPASAPNAITVSATEAMSDNFPNFSNFGPCVNILAPGVNITAAGNKRSTDLMTLTGTSQAAPHVAGAVALIISSSGNRSPAEMKIELDNLSTKDVINGLYFPDRPITPNRLLR
ncbi:3990_t:CDS:2, partial [Scutellospora calospora]